MDFKKAYGAINVLEVEIRDFANEGYAVKYDFGRKVISWRDNYMWNNNFTRAISDANSALINEKLPASGMLEWMEGYNKGLTDEYGDKTIIPGEWSIKVEFKDKTPAFKNISIYIDEDFELQLTDTEGKLYDIKL